MDRIQIVCIKVYALNYMENRVYTSPGLDQDDYYLMMGQLLAVIERLNDGWSIQVLDDLTGIVRSYDPTTCSPFSLYDLLRARIVIAWFELRKEAVGLSYGKFKVKVERLRKLTLEEQRWEDQWFDYLEDLYRALKDPERFKRIAR